MKLFIDYEPPNWNKYIELERSNYYGANNLKQKEKRIIKLICNNQKYNGSYPIKMIFRPHFDSFRKDLDNFRYKGILDGLVSCGVIKNDNLKHIQKIELEPIFDNVVGVEVEILEMERKVI